MTICIQHQVTGEWATVVRDVCHRHPHWVHAQCGTTTEAELQHSLAQYDVGWFYRTDGSHKGPDEFGVAMYRSLEETEEAEGRAQ